MKDILLIETNNGGDMVIENNDIKMTNSFVNQVYLALFGGNVYSDNGEQQNEYWANELFIEENKYQSMFEKTMMEVVLNSSGLEKIKQAVDVDLAYLKKYANFTIDVSILSKDSLSLYILIKAPNNTDEKIRIIWNNGLITVNV